jgi:hypothetical protein
VVVAPKDGGKSYHVSRPSQHPYVTPPLHPTALSPGVPQALRGVLCVPGGNHPQPHHVHRGPAPTPVHRGAGVLAGETTRPQTTLTIQLSYHHTFTHTHTHTHTHMPSVCLSARTLLVVAGALAHPSAEPLPHVYTHTPHPCHRSARVHGGHRRTGACVLCSADMPPRPVSCYPCPHPSLFTSQEGVDSPSTCPRVCPFGPCCL